MKSMKDTNVNDGPPDAGGVISHTVAQPTTVTDVVRDMTTSPGSEKVDGVLSALPPPASTLELEIKAVFRNGVWQVEFPDGKFIHPRFVNQLLHVMPRKVAVHNRLLRRPVQTPMFASGL